MATITLQHPANLSQTFARRIVGRVTGNGYTINASGLVTVDTRDSTIMLANGWLPVPGGGGGAGATSGSALIDFGSFPGSAFAQTLVVAVDAADPLAVVDVWILPAATADHSIDEHVVDPPMVSGYADGAGNVVITGIPRFGLTSPIPPDPMPYGKWNVAWAFSP